MSLICNQQVAGSNPIASSSSINKEFLNVRITYAKKNKAPQEAQKTQIIPAILEQRGRVDSPCLPVFLWNHNDFTGVTLPSHSEGGRPSKRRILKPAHRGTPCLSYHSGRNWEGKPALYLLIHRLHPHSYDAHSGGDTFGGGPPGKPGCPMPPGPPGLNGLYLRIQAWRSSSFFAACTQVFSC